MGLRGERSGTFWPFWKAMEALVAEGRAPSIVLLGNVCEALTPHKGKDFAPIGTAVEGGGYRFGALVIDAVHFAPQSCREPKHTPHAFVEKRTVVLFNV